MKLIDWLRQATTKELALKIQQAQRQAAGIFLDEHYCKGNCPYDGDCDLEENELACIIHWLESEMKSLPALPK